MADVRVPLAVALSSFGLPATVKTKDDTTIVTTGFWLTALEEPDSPRSDYERRDSRKVFVVPRADVPSPQRGTYVFAPEYLGGPVCRWRFNGIARSMEPDAMRLIVSLDPEISA